jgi:hypothetical protein
MKKLILTTALLVVSYLGFSQATPTGQFRVKDRTTLFGQNLPVGTQIFCVSDSTLWDVIVPVGTGLNITTAIAANSLDLVNGDSKYFSQVFEAAGAVAAGGTYTLTHTPITNTTGVTVLMNGAALRPTTDYTTSGVTLTIVGTQLTYDKFVVSYTYNSH